MRFSSSLNVDVTKWKTAKMERQSALKAKEKEGSDAPKFGAGSEYGKEAKEEAKRLKYAKKSQADEPWLLKIGGKTGRR